MNAPQLLQAILAFIFVLGLLFITLWLIRFCQQKGLNCQIIKPFKTAKKIKIIEHHRIDIKNSLVLFECLNEEFLILAGQNSNILLKQTKNKRKSDNNE